MSLDIYFFKKGFDIQKSRTDIDATYTKLHAIKENWSNSKIVMRMQSFPLSTLPIT